MVSFQHLKIWNETASPDSRGLLNLKLLPRMSIQLTNLCKSHTHLECVPIFIVGGLPHPVSNELLCCLGEAEKEMDAEVLGSLPVGAISDPVQ